MRNASIIAQLLVLTTVVNAQEKPAKDPLLKFVHFYEMGFTASATRINTNHAVFKTDAGTYQFDKGKFLPTYDGFLNAGWIFKDDNKSIYLVKTGVNLLSRSSNVSDSSGFSLRYNEGLLQIPIELGLRSPIKYNTIRNDLFRAVEIFVGGYIATPLYEKLESKDNLDAKSSFNFGSTLRFGLVGEIAFSALNTKGYGHRLGIRFTNDFTTVIKLKQTKYQLYPYYYSVGIFYNIMNRYHVI